MPANPHRTRPRTRRSARQRGAVKRRLPLRLVQIHFGDGLIGKPPPLKCLLELFALLDARYRSGKPTIFTTQYQSPKELGHRLMESGGDKPTAQAIVRRVFGGGEYQAEVVRC